MRVWAIYYTVRANSKSKWCGWVGPCGVNILGDIFQPFERDCLSGRPLFFRTRTLARLRAWKLGLQKNKTWEWVRYQVRPIELIYVEIKN